MSNDPLEWYEQQIQALVARAIQAEQRAERLADIVKVKNSEIDALRGAKDAQKERAEALQQEIERLREEMAQHRNYRILRERTQWKARAEAAEGEIARLRAERQQG